MPSNGSVARHCPARAEVASVIESVMGSINTAQREASRGVEDAVKQAEQRFVDTRREELITR